MIWNASRFETHVFLSASTQAVSQSRFYWVRHVTCLTSQNNFIVNNNIYHLINIINGHVVAFSIVRHRFDFNILPSQFGVLFFGVPFRFLSINAYCEKDGHERQPFGIQKAVVRGHPLKGPGSVVKGRRSVLETGSLAVNGLCGINGCGLQEKMRRRADDGSDASRLINRVDLSCSTSSIVS